MFGKRIKTAAAEVGIKFAETGVTANTIEANRLIRFAGTKGPGLQHKLVSLLFEGYFMRGENVGERQVLLRIAIEAGLDGGQVASYLDSEEDKKYVVAETAAARRKGVTGVPHYVFNQGYELTGGQSVQAFEHLLRTLAKKASSPPQSNL